MQNFTTLIVDMVKKEKLFASQGGPIILTQVLFLFSFPSTDNSFIPLKYLSITWWMIF